MLMRAINTFMKEKEVRKGDKTHWSLLGKNVGTNVGKTDHKMESKIWDRK